MMHKNMRKIKCSTDILLILKTQNFKRWNGTRIDNLNLKYAWKLAKEVQNFLQLSDHPL